MRVIVLVQRILEEWSDWWDVLSAMQLGNDLTLVFFGDAAFSILSKQPSCRFYVYANENTVFGELRIDRDSLSNLLQDADRVLTI